MWRDNTIEQNVRIWDTEHRWVADGDEWTDQARWCGKEYSEWKRSLVELLTPYCRGATVLEIGAGHGRWSSEILPVCRRAWLVDVSPNCLEYCRQRFAAVRHVTYHLTDGKSLPGEITGQVDFVWSYDSFVHMSRDTVEAYCREIARVLAPGGHAVIHHPGRRHSTLWLGWLRVLGDAGRLLYRLISLGPEERDDGWRSNVSAKVVADAAASAGLHMHRQFRSWNGACYTRFGDVISVMAKPRPAGVETPSTPALEEAGLRRR